ncbi:MAG: hypothetical protein ATN35_03695 [Epulopiscium sp. Nele67-Bin004]|nr:MAG: hypothetical protein ATN35_03695 [Epulopiscium sp. Nele67-Bin004]
MYFYNVVSKIGKNGRVTVFLALLLNTIVISSLFMFALGLDNTVNDKLSTSDAEQMSFVVSLITVIAIVIIGFIQWIVVTLYSSLLESRKSFNTMVRMIGMGKKKLYNVYFSEFVMFQILTMPIAIVLAYVCYGLIGNMAGGELQPLEPQYIVLAIVTNFVVTLVSFSRAYYKNSKTHQYFDVIEAKKQRKTGLLTKVLKILCVSLVGVSLILMSLPMMFTEYPFYGYATFFLGLIFLWDEVIKVFCKLAKKMFPAKYNIAVILFESNIKSVTIVSYTIMLGLSMCIGMYGMFATMRNASYNMVQDYIHYEYWGYKNDFSMFDDPNLEGVSTGLVTFENTVMSSTLPIFAVDSEYVDDFETVELKYTDMTSDQLKVNLDDPTFNGIVVMSGLISEEQVGDTIELMFFGVPIEFVIVGGYDSTISYRYFNLVSKSYVYEQLGLDQSQANNFFSKISVDSFIDEDFFVVNKEEIATTNKENVLKMTFVIEFPIIVLLVASIFMLGNFIYLSAGKNKLDIARFRALGVAEKDVNTAYILNYSLIVMLSICPSALGGYAIAKSLAHLGSGMSDRYIEYGTIMPWGLFVTVVVLILLFIVAMYFVVTGSARKNYLDLVRTKMQAE